MLKNLPKTINATEILDSFDIGDVDASEDSLLKNELCVCKIQPIRDFLRGNKSIILGHRGAGKTALFRLVSEGRLNFSSGDENTNHIILTIDEELQFHTIHSIIKQRVKSAEDSMWLTYRFLWEFFILYKIAISLDEKFNSPAPIKDIANKLRELFEGKAKKSTLADFIRAQKKTVGMKIDSSAAPIPVPDFYFSAEPIQNESSDIFDDAITLNIGEYKKKINSFLKSQNVILNILIDKLDDFVLQKEYDIQRSIIQGLLYCERDYLGLKNIRLKIFIRTDIFRNLDFKQLMWEKITSRTIELKWTNEDIRDFFSKRIAFNFLFKIQLERISFVFDEEEMYIDQSSTSFIPKDNNKILQINLNEFKNSIERVTSVSLDRKEGLKMTIGKDSLKLSVNSPNSGEGVENIKANYNSEEMNISFNSRYIIDIASQIEHETIIVNLKEAGSPVLIKDLSDKLSFHVVMPMKI